MIFKKSSGWKACFDEDSGRYFGEYGGVQDYHLYEITKELFERLDEKMGEWDAGNIIHDGRHMYMSVNDRCGPPYTVIFDDEYERLCPWASVIKSGREWPDELTDAAVQVFASEEMNRGQRRKNREEREKQKEDQ
ncbi:MAG: hypothetical protein IJ746_04010 [Ruminococcus sp.]|nr:hypothetical protein [Ruminococcus sp.]